MIVAVVAAIDALALATAVGNTPGEIAGVLCVPAVCVPEVGAPVAIDVEADVAKTGVAAADIGLLPAVGITVARAEVPIGLPPALGVGTAAVGAVLLAGLPLVLVLEGVGAVLVGVGAVLAVLPPALGVAATEAEAGLVGPPLLPGAVRAGVVLAKFPAVLGVAAEIAVLPLGTGFATLGVLLGNGTDCTATAGCESTTPRTG